MDNRAEVREFLTTRRAKLSPQQAGLPDVGGRRVPGLRRGEVAALAGVSIEYYAKLERGSLAGASAVVLDAVARALQLDDAERTYLFDLARAADDTGALLRPRRRTTKRWTTRPALQWALGAITAGPAIVRNGRMDLFATNLCVPPVGLEPAAVGLGRLATPSSVAFTSIFWSHGILLCCRWRR